MMQVFLLCDVSMYKYLDGWMWVWVWIWIPEVGKCTLQILSDARKKKKEIQGHKRFHTWMLMHFFCCSGSDDGLKCR